jgi:hypothetical protein
LSPKVVQDIEKHLVDRLDRKVALFFRCMITKDVGASGSASLLARPSLDGAFRPTDETNAAQIVQVAEQSMRDVLVDRPDIILEDVRSVRMPSGLVVIASIESSHRPVPSQIKRVEALIRQGLGRSDITLLVRSVETTATTGKGRVLLGQSHFSRLSADDQHTANQLESSARRQIEQGGQRFVTSVDAQKGAKRWTLRAEVVGAQIPTPENVKAIEAELAREAASPVALSMWARNEVVVTGRGYDSVDRLVEQQVTKRYETTHPSAATPAGDFEKESGSEAADELGVPSVRVTE